MIEADAFPSDIYAIESQIKFHGHDPSQTLIKLKPRKEEAALRTEDIISEIEELDKKSNDILKSIKRNLSYIDFEKVNFIYFWNNSISFIEIRSLCSISSS